MPTRILLIAVFAILSSSFAAAAIRNVGPGQTYATPCAAIAVATANDTIQIDASGSYAGDVCAWSTNGLTIRGINGRAHIDAAGQSSQGKAIWVIAGNDTTVDNIEFSGCQVADNNGAGIRQEGANLTVLHSYFHDNQEGILAGDNAASTITIQYTEFRHNGAGDGYSHNLYINHVATLMFAYNWSHDAVVGHLLKTRALQNFILYNRLTGEPGGSESYELSMPSAGTSFVIGNLVEQPTTTQNPAMLDYFSEPGSGANPDDHLFVVNNTFVNDLGHGTFLQIGASTSTPVVATNNIFYGGGTLSSQGNTIFNHNYSGNDPKFVDATTFDYRLQSGSPAIDAGVSPGSGAGQSLTPTNQYVQPTGAMQRPIVGVIDIGAYEYDPQVLPAFPIRILDTRTGAATSDGLFAGIGPVGSAGSLALTVAGRGGVPASGAVAAVLNVTATYPTAAGYITMWPTGSARPLASNLNFVAGQTIPNLVVAKLGSGGQVSLFNAAGSTDLIADVAWYFTAASQLSALNPARVLDTRTGSTTIDGQFAGIGALAAGHSLNLSLAGRGGLPASGIGSVILNVTATNPTAASYVTVWPTGQGRPLASNLNVVPAQTIPNLVISAVSASGQVSLYNAAGSLDLIADVMGWFPSGAALTSLLPARVLDTRVGMTTIDGQFAGIGALGTANILDLTVAGRGGVPASGAGAVVLNVTAVNPTAAGYLTVWPSGNARPNASNLNFVPGQIIPNLVIALVGSNGKVSLFNSAGATDIVVDVVGWLPPGP